jgi:hypothetical protein
MKCLLVRRSVSQALRDSWSSEVLADVMLLLSKRGTHCRPRAHPVHLCGSVFWYFWNC